MAKHTKLTSKPGARGTASSPDAAHDPKALLARTAMLLERLVTAVEGALSKGEGNSALIRESAGLVRAAASLSAEQRAITKAAEATTVLQEDNIVSHLTPAIVIRYLMELPNDRRNFVLFEVQGSRGRSGLA